MFLRLPFGRLLSFYLHPPQYHHILFSSATRMQVKREQSSERKTQKHIMHSDDVNEDTDSGDEDNGASEVFEL
jgi:hypothetical protein